MAWASSSRASRASLALLGAMRAQGRQHDLLDQSALAIDGAFHGAQVLGPQAGAGQAGGATRPRSASSSV